MTSPPTARDRAKAERSDAILREAARLFAESGYNGVSLEDPVSYTHLTLPTKA